MTTVTVTGTATADNVTVTTATTTEAQERTNSIKQRDRLFNQYLPLANKIACKKQRNMPKCVQLEELKSAAYFGLLDAATKYDPEKHDQFPVYARIRILGEINDYLRRCTWGGRNRQFYGWSLDVPVYGCRSRRPVPLDEGLCEQQKMAASEAEEFFVDLTKSLPQKVRNILRYYYLDGLTMKEISLIEGLCESRVSQLMSHYKKVLQKIWAGKEDELFSALQPRNQGEKFRLNTGGWGGSNEGAEG
jgi:RNA polymerase sigma factor (sigma-70 family)